MTLILKILSNYWKQIVVITAIGFLAFWGYNTIYDRGAAANDAKWQERMEVYEKARDEKISNIEGYTRTTLEQQLINNHKTAKDIDSLVVAGKKGPVVVFKEGKCQLTPDFVTTYNAIIDKANK
mgnify:CR=1 FL=1